MYECGQLYVDLQKYGISNEDARMVLPNACETQIEVKMNLRALMNFMNERLCSCAQWEIRELAMKMRNAIIEKVPGLMPYLVPKCEKNGPQFGACNESKSRSCGRHPRLQEIFDCYNEFNGVQGN
jgi:thymidylate synthase (FAD)